jgi:hypothetical protein
MLHNQTIKDIKEWFDEATDAMRIVRYFADREYLESKRA